MGGEHDGRDREGWGTSPERPREMGSEARPDHSLEEPRPLPPHSQAPTATASCPIPFNDTARHLIDS